MTVNHQKQLTVPPFAPSAKSSTVEQHSFLDVDSIPLSLKRSDEFPYIEGYKLALRGYYGNFNGQNKSRLLWKPDISFTALRRKSIRCVKWSLNSLLVVLDGK